DARGERQASPGNGSGLSQLSGEAPHAALRWANRQKIRSPRQRQLGPAPALAASCFRDASPRRWRRSSRHSRTPRPPIPLHHPEIHPRFYSPAHGNLRQDAPPRLGFVRTPGSVGIFVNLSPVLRLFYVGDAVDDERGFEERVAKSLILRDSDNDMVLAFQVVGRLSEIRENALEYSLITANDSHELRNLCTCV